VYWLVFQSHALAVADYRAFDFAMRKGLTCSKISPATGFAKPGEVLNGTAGDYGFTEVRVVVDNVIVSGNFDFGHPARAKATGRVVAFNLARWAIAELKRAGGQADRPTTPRETRSELNRASVGASALGRADNQLRVRYSTPSTRAAERDRFASWSGWAKRRDRG
jgi:hypothetical protein